MHVAMSHLVAQELLAESHRNAEQHRLTAEATRLAAVHHDLQHARVRASLLAVPRSDRKHSRAG